MTPAAVSWGLIRRTGSTANSQSLMTVVPLGGSSAIRSFSLALTSALGLEPLLTLSTPISGTDTRVTGTGMSRPMSVSIVAAELREETHNHTLTHSCRTLQHMYENNIGNNIMLSGDSVRSSDPYMSCTNRATARKLGL